MAVTHLGQPIPDDLDFFVAPPPSIGTVSSQYSTLKMGQTGTVSKDFVMFTLIFAGIAIICGVIYFFTNNVLAIAGALLFGGFAGLRALNTKRFECNYVGDKGIARYRVGKKDETQPNLEGGVFLFDSVKNLYTNVIETEGIIPFYGQNAVYQWTLESNKALLSILTDQYDPRKLPEGDEVICFLRAAEAAWTNHLIGPARQMIASGGTVEFPYRMGGKVSLNSQGLKIELRDEAEIAGSDLSAILHSAGDLQFVTKAGGKAIKCDCSHFSNIMLLETLVCEMFGLTRGDSGIKRD